MLKLQDFAVQCQVTDRQVQRLIKKYEEELEGHFERKGHNGTWLDETACEILRGKMKIKPIAVIDSSLVQENKELKDKVERKDIIIERLQEREQTKNRMLEMKDQMIDQLTNERLLLEEKNQKQLEEERQAKEEAQLQAAAQAAEAERQRQEKEAAERKIEELQKQLDKPLNWKERILGRRL